MPITPSRSAGYSTGALAKRAGVHLENIRYFERIGLIPKPDRAANGRRQFGDEHLRRLIFIRRAREMGFSQAEVRALIALSDGTPGSCEEVKSIADATLHVIREKIGGLRRMERVLSAASAQCASGRAPCCPLIDVLLRNTGAPQPR